MPLNNTDFNRSDLDSMGDEEWVTCPIGEDKGEVCLLKDMRTSEDYRRDLGNGNTHGKSEVVRPLFCES